MYLDQTGSTAAERGSRTTAAGHSARERPTSTADTRSASRTRLEAGSARTSDTGSTRRDPTRPRPGKDREATTPAPPRRALRRLRTALVLASALVFALTGTAWGLYRDITSGITTTDVITGGSNGGAQNILIVGVDSRTDAQGNPLPQEILDKLNSGADTGVLNSDTIILLHVPKGGGAAVAFSIPRDAYVDIPGYRRDKINAAYPATKALTAERLVGAGQRDRASVEAAATKAGRTALIKTVEDLTGISVDHYAEINLLGFYNLTTAIGGVDVCLKAAVDDDLSGARLPAGPQTISGGDALAFVRQRHGLPGGDLSRIRRQQAFLAAVSKKILSGGTLTDRGKLGALVDVAQKSVVIDSGWDLLAFARQASAIATGHLEFLTVPTRGSETNNRGDVVLVDRSDVRGFVDRQVADADAAASAEPTTAPPPSATPEPPPPPVAVVAARYVVDVRNASTAPGLAATVAAHLRGLGFVRGRVDNAGSQPGSVVRYTGSDGAAARSVADQLGGIATESSTGVSAGHLLVVLGADFTPAAVGAPAAPTAPAPSAAPATGPITAAGVPCID